MDKFKDDERGQHLLRLAIACEQELDRVANHGPTLLPLQLVPGEQYFYTRNKFLKVGLSEDLPDYRLAPLLVRILLYRRLLEHRPEQPVALADMPEWLVAAVTWRIRDRQQRLLPNTFFPAAHGLVLHDFAPDVERLINEPPTTKDSILFYVYGEYCAILLKAILRNDSRSIDGYLRVYDPTRRKSEQVADILPRVARTRGIRHWYRDVFRASAIWALDPDSPTSIVDGLDRLQTVSFIAPGTGTGMGGNVKTVHLDGLDDTELRQLRSTRAFSTLRSNLIRLGLRSPILLRPELDACSAILEAAPKRKASAFREEWRQATEKVRATATRCTQVSAYLDTVEVGVYGPLTRLAPFMQGLREGIPPTDYEQKVRSYLSALSTHGPGAPSSDLSNLDLSAVPGAEVQGAARVQGRLDLMASPTLPPESAAASEELPRTDLSPASVPTVDDDDSAP